MQTKTHANSNSCISDFGKGAGHRRKIIRYPRIFKGLRQRGSELARISLRLFSHRRTVKAKVRLAGTAAKTALHSLAAKLKLRGGLTITCHEGCGLHPRAAVLALMAVMNANVAATLQ